MLGCLPTLSISRVAIWMLLCEVARVQRVTVVCGLNECERSRGGGTLYNTVVVIDADGKLRNRHRKLMPTNPERMVHGPGDASGLRAVDTPVGRVGALICWENYMPLARYALYAEGVEIYVAPTYDSGDGWISTMRHIALEGRCWVLGSGSSVAWQRCPRRLSVTPGTVSRPGGMDQPGRLGGRRSSGQDRRRSDATRDRHSLRRH
jgi:hypothetical protein